MNYHIDSIQISENSFSPYNIVSSQGLTNDESPKWLNDLSRVNLMVGENNSGKSRFLRGLAQVKKLHFRPTQTDELLELHSLRGELQNRIISHLDASDIQEVGGLRQQTMELSNFAEIDEDEDILKPLNQFFAEWSQDKRYGQQYLMKGRFTYNDVPGFMPVVQNIISEFRDRFVKLQEARRVREKYNFKRIYIPTLRGLRRFSNAADCYQDRTREDYFKDAASVEIFTGLSLFDDVRDLLLGSREERQAIQDFQNFISQQFFRSVPVTLIPRIRREVLYVKIGDEEEQPIHNLGDGIQSIIILTFPLFRHKGDDLLVFIEEPELYMHPGLQRVLLNTFRCGDGFESYQYFLATHSNHFLDLTLDVEEVSIYTFHKQLDDSKQFDKNACYTVENVSNEDERSLVLLGTQNTSVFLANCTIWVEGITDRRYFAHYLNLYQAKLESQDEERSKPVRQHFKQDLHYAFVEYAGSNITHWSFLEDDADAMQVDRICGRLFLITDKDDAENAAKKERHEKLRSKLRDRYYCLACREVENLLSPEILRKVLSDYEKNSERVKAVAYEQYASKPLGRFIDQKMVSPEGKRRTYAAESGTITDKLGFCQRALEHLNSFDDLSLEAQELTKKLYQFIESRNPTN